LNSRSLTGFARLHYKATDHITLFTAGEFYAQNLNQLPGVPTSRRRIYAGIELHVWQSRHAANGGHARAAPPTNDIQSVRRTE
jgi:hypothetical protein